MTIYQPYTYVITHLPTGHRYYGVRYKKGCNPSDLWNTYFTSSKYVKALILKTGKNSFIVEVRKKFKDKDTALSWENKVLRRLKVVKKSWWINKTDNFIITVDTFTEDTRRKIAKAATGRVGTRLGVKLTLETKLKMGAAKAKSYTITCPDGVTSVVSNLTSYCKSKGLTRANLLKVANGKRNHHRGFICRHIKNSQKFA